MYEHKQIAGAAQPKVASAVSYKKLWVRLAEQELKKKDLCRLAGISPTVVTKLGHGESVTTDVLVRVCRALSCNIGDIMDVLPENKMAER